MPATDASLTTTSAHAPEELSSGTTHSSDSGGWEIVDVSVPEAAKEHLVEGESKTPAEKEPKQGAEEPSTKQEKEAWTECQAPNGQTDAKGEHGECAKELDLCFVCDCTGSMGQYIRAAQENIRSIVTKISALSICVRFALISYRDHPQAKHSGYVTRRFDFTTSVEQMQEYVASMSAEGGGDGPEAVAAALHEALHMPWRPNATKVSVLIADAPPHGLEASGDVFPNGDPDGRDPLEILREMARNSITVYAVGCEPALGRYQFARDFMCTCAEITGGQAVALASASLLADAIVNGSAEEVALTKLTRHVEQEMRRAQQEARDTRGVEMSFEEAVTATTQTLRARGMMSEQMETDGVMESQSRGKWGSSQEKKSLREVKAQLLSERSRRSTAEPASAPAVMTKNELRSDLIKADQVTRTAERLQYQDKLSFSSV
mmetsp:Transcript_55155/g.129129  ORF Transcript_55155/g.129129 Transcript_55155/m.129129 type:complete len:434 (+) Transcript_55155:83-1384(+)